ncbi:MAG: D-sedoheptulose 7-phosphate isomerase [Candidatus Neomarinimicrobiota bacterium]|nr:D-sedoheptulose 7-phosphate isomerase [Candidatus Neomarinimicrobiota bacterium]
MSKQKNFLNESIENHRKVIENLANQSNEILDIIDIAKYTLSNQNKILFCGNGGSAADSQHLAAEFTGRFISKKQPLPAIALTTDTSAITAIGNDFSFDEIFSRQVNALGVKGDLLFAISTSGNSANVLKAVEESKKIGIKSIGLLGNDGGKISEICDHSIVIKSNITSRIQEAHIFIGHLVCESVDDIREY